MQLDRLDLADIHAPGRLARAIHAQLGRFDGAVPVIRIAKGLDIAEVRIETLDGVEGMLLTDTVRSRGAILANKRRGSRRARFTIAHELGHFLLERHVLTDADGFRCTNSDMRETREGRRQLRQESEANRFAAELLAPSSRVDGLLSPEPDLRDAQRMRDALDLSLDACTRRLIERRDELLAAVWSYKGRVRYAIRGRWFPYIPLNRGDWLPRTSDAFRVVASGQPGFSRIADTHAQAWTDRPDLAMSEQTRLGPTGYAITLLKAELPDDGENEADLPELGVPGFS